MTIREILMNLSRRRLFHCQALAAGCGAAGEAAEPAISLDVLRNVSAFQGVDLSDDRLRVLKPVLEHRLATLRALRDFEIEDSVAPAEGTLA